MRFSATGWIAERGFNPGAGSGMSSSRWYSTTRICCGLPSQPKKDFSNSECLSCHALTAGVAKKRSGYWHYEQSHQKVLDRGYECGQCHSDLYPHDAKRHKVDCLA